MPEEKKEKQCFVIAPIGGDGTSERKRSNVIQKHVISPVVVECGYPQVVRADQISRPGLITNQIIEHLLNDDLVIADLTGKNPNVFYELAIRHAIRKPMVQLIQSGEEIPFDLHEMRTIQLDHTDLDSVAKCRDELKKQISEVEKDPSLIDTPLSVVIDLQSSRSSRDPTEKMLLQLLDRMNELSFQMRRMEKSTGFDRSENLRRRERMEAARLELEARRRGLREQLEGIQGPRRIIGRAVAAAAEEASISDGPPDSDSDPTTTVGERED
jgi:hypothetical protein